MTEWFRRKTAKIKTFDRKDIEKGKWQKCSNCGEMLYSGNLEKNLYTCSNCNYHLRMPSSMYKRILFDKDTVTEIAQDLESVDILDFHAQKEYKKQIQEAKNKTDNKDAINIYCGKINNQDCVLGVMNFSFIGGSLGSVVGQKMHQIGSKRQVLCITHLAPVAATGSRHYLVEKEVENDRTLTRVRLLTENARIDELTRMLGGSGDAARYHAEELLKP